MRTLIDTTGRDLIFSSVFQEENVIQLQTRGAAACCSMSTPGQMVAIELKVGLGCKFVVADYMVLVANCIFTSNDHFYILTAAHVLCSAL